jgi:hypothetical protein
VDNRAAIVTTIITDKKRPKRHDYIILEILQYSNMYVSDLPLGGITENYCLKRLPK